MAVSCLIKNKCSTYFVAERIREDLSNLFNVSEKEKSDVCLCVACFIFFCSFVSILLSFLGL